MSKNKNRQRINVNSEIIEIEGVITPEIISDQVIDTNLVNALVHEIVDDLDIEAEIRKLEESEINAIIYNEDEVRDSIVKEYAEEYDQLANSEKQSFEDAAIMEGEIVENIEANYEENILEDDNVVFETAEEGVPENNNDTEDEFSSESEINFLEDGSSEEDPNSRTALMNEIRKFYHILDMPLLEKNFENMDDIALLEHVRLLRINNGGSINIAAILQRTEVEYDNYLRSDTMKMRMNLIAEKGADFIAISQKLRQLIGNDFVINQTRSTEYHNMLKSATSTISVLHDKIAQIASLLGVSFTNDSFNPRGDTIPIVEGIPADPRIAIAVLNTLAAYVDKFNSIQTSNVQQLARNTEKIKRLEDGKKALENRLQEVQDHAASILSKYDEYTKKDCFWIIVDERKGSILRKINPDVKVQSTEDLDLRGTLDTAFKFPNKSAANTWAQRIMQTKRFSKRSLVVKRVSVVFED